VTANALTDRASVLQIDDKFMNVLSSLSATGRTTGPAMKISYPGNLSAIA
jgi:hypothetical protein